MPSDKKVYRLREAILMSKRLGRPLTAEINNKERIGGWGYGIIWKEKYGIRDYLPREAAPQPVPAPEPMRQPDKDPSIDEMLEELEATGALLQETKSELEQMKRNVMEREGKRPARKPEVTTRYEAADSQANQTETVKKADDSLMNRADAAMEANRLEEAFSLYEEAARQGLAEAQFKCGSMYDKGLGVADDVAKALDWYEKAAVQGHADAQKYI